MQLRVIIVEPIYQINLGYIARVSKNFGVNELTLINPKCKYKGKEAIKYSKHAHDLLTNAKISNSIAKATKGTFVVGTTAIWRKTGEAFHNVYSLDRLIGMVKRNKIRKVSLLIGRDNIGLTKEELAMCDATAFIETDDKYPALNISHALGIMLYAFSGLTKETSIASMSARPEELKRIEKLFTLMISKRKDIRDKKAVTMAFEHIVNRAAPTQKEIGALSVALSPRRKR